MRGHGHAHLSTRRTTSRVITFFVLILVAALTLPAIAGRNGRSPLRLLLEQTLQDLDEGRFTKSERRRLRRVLAEMRAGHAAGPPIGRPDGASAATLKAIADRCRRLVYDAGPRQDCVAALAHRDAPTAVGIINACDTLGYTDHQELTCVKGVARNPSPIESVQACDRAFYSDNEELRCVAALQYAPPEIVKTCDRAFYADAYELLCVESMGHRQDAAGVIAYCDRLAYSDADTLSCLRRFGGR